MKVSAIIPNYNHSQFLAQRIDSVLAQTYENLEVVILDDASTDDSKMVIEKYRHSPRVTQIIYNETNSGSTFKQWHKGLTAATGEIAWVAESDDWSEPNFLEVLVTGLLKSPGCVLAYAQSYCVDANNNIRLITKAANLEEWMPGIDFIQQHLIKRNPIINASMAIFRRDVFFQIPQDFTNFRFAGDWLFWIETAKQGSVFICGKVLNFFRKHDKDVSGKVYATGYDYIDDLKILGYLKKYSLISEKSYRQFIFLKYQKFKLNKTKYTVEAIAMINECFLAMFPDRKEAKKYLWYMQLKSSVKDITSRKKS
jgi:glycosyltransferase involved in cell wall biosynthesis